MANVSSTSSSSTDYVYSSIQNGLAEVSGYHPDHAKAVLHHCSTPYEHHPSRKDPFQCKFAHIRPEETAFESCRCITALFKGDEYVWQTGDLWQTGHYCLNPESHIPDDEDKPFSFDLELLKKRYPKSVCPEVLRLATKVQEDLLSAHFPSRVCVIDCDIHQTSHVLVKKSKLLNRLVPPTSSSSSSSSSSLLNSAALPRSLPSSSDLLYELATTAVSNPAVAPLIDLDAADALMGIKNGDAANILSSWSRKRAAPDEAPDETPEDQGQGHSKRVRLSPAEDSDIVTEPDDDVVRPSPQPKSRIRCRSVKINENFLPQFYPVGSHIMSGIYKWDLESWKGKEINLVRTNSLNKTFKKTIEFKYVRPELEKKKTYLIADLNSESLLNGEIPCYFPAVLIDDAGDHVIFHFVDVNGAPYVDESGKPIETRFATNTGLTFRVLPKLKKVLNQMPEFRKVRSTSTTGAQTQEFFGYNLS